MKKLLLSLMCLIASIAVNAEVMESEDTWTIAGSKMLCGSLWDATDTSNDMTAKDNVFILVKENVMLRASVYYFSVCKNHTWDEKYGLYNNNVEDAVLVIEEDGAYQVTFTFTYDEDDISSSYVEASVKKTGSYVIPDDTEQTWTVAGVSELCGVEWDPTATENDMTTEDGHIFKWKKSDVALDKETPYGFKVVAGHSWYNDSYGSSYGNRTGNYEFFVEKPGLYTIEIIFNLYTLEISATITKTADYEFGEKTWTICGVEALCGVEWDPTATENDMEKTGAGEYTLVKREVTLQAMTEYEYKVAANHKWTESYGMNGGASNNIFMLDEDQESGLYDVTFTFLTTTKALTASAKIHDFPNLDEAKAFYYVGSLNDWSTTDKSYPFTLLEDGKTWELTITSFENDGWFKIAPDFAYNSQNDFWNLAINAPYDGCEELSGKIEYGEYGGAWHLPQSDSIYSYTIRMTPSEMTFSIEITPIVVQNESDAIIVLDSNGNDVTNETEIIWYDTNKNRIANGSIIGGIAEGTEVYYSVLLNQKLGMRYREVILQKTIIDRSTRTISLQPIEEVALHGKVVAYGVSLPRVNVSLTQWLNGKYEHEISVLTDANGEFSLNAYNDSTELIVTANGYIDYKTVRRNLNNGGEFGDIDMIEVQGKVIALNLCYQEATRDGAEPIVQNWYSDTRNIEYTVQNVTKGKEIDDFAIQQGNIVMPTGTDRGDKIQITVRSLNEKFAKATAEGIIADNDTANVSITLLAFGGIEATYDQKADDNLLAMLYDSTGKLQMRTVCSTSRLTFTNLAAGNYTLVTMGYNGAIGSVSNISELANMDLAEGTDYVRSTAAVRDGYIASVNVASVPELDASKFEYTGKNTSYMPNKIQLVTGNFITLTTRLDFKEQYTDKINHAKIVIDIPEGCTFVSGSVVIGSKPIPHTLNGNKLTITVGKDDLDQRIRFCVIPNETGSFMTTAMAEFDYKGAKTQPIGQVKFEATLGELYVPSTTKTSTITLGGIGVPKTDVEVYDNDALIGTTKSLGNGKWSITCELPNSYNFSYHDIYVKYRGEGNVVGRTESKKCIHDINAIVPKTVTMVNTAHPAGDITPKVYETVFNYETVMAVQNYYLYWPEYPDFTFLIDLSENDTTKVSDVTLYVHTTDGDKRKIPAVYNGKLNRFVATSSFDMYRLPVNVSLDYYYNESTSIDDTERSNDEYSNIKNAFAKLETYINDYYEINTIKDDETIALFDMIDSKTNINQQLEIELLNPNNLNINDFVYVKDTTNGVNFYLKEFMNSNCFEAIVIEEDFTNAYKIKTSTDASSNGIRTQKANIRNRGPIAQGIEYAANAIIPYYEYTNGVIDYNFWKSKLPIDDDEITKERNEAYRLLMSTCPDGTLKLSTAWLSALSKTYQWLCSEHSAFSNNGYDMLEIWRKELLKQFAFESATLGVGKALKAIPNIKVFYKNSKNSGAWGYLVKGGRNNRERVEAMIEDGIGNIGGFMEDQYVDMSISQRFSSWEPKEKSNLIRQFRSLQENIKSNYQKCGKDDDDNSDGKTPETEPEIPKEDPSGFVYEAVPTNRIEGVKATVYYSEDEYGDFPVMWDAAEYGEINPQVTDESGLYAWDVPQGFWKVVFEKEGYETTQTDWLPVPPPQLEVNIPMSQAVAPYVEDAKGMESGITLDFSKYMKPNTLTKSNRVTVTCNGEKAKGDVELLNLEENPYNNEEYVSKIKFVPNKSFKTTDEVIITVKKEVESYAGKEMTEDFVQRVKIESEITEIACDSVMAIDYQGTGVLELSVLPAAAAKGRTVQVASTSTMIASTDAQSVTLNEEGKARITVSGELPGNASLHLSMPEAGMEKYVAVTVVTKEEEVVKAPKASKLSGSQFDNSYLLTLTCATKGATIYYTIDGSCPCDEQTRIKYTGPITLPEGQVTLQAIAVREGMADSDIATFNYTVQKEGLTGIKVIEEIIDFEAIYQEGSIVISGAKGASCHIYDLQGHELASRSRISNQVKINVPKSDLYIVSVLFNNEQTIVHKVLAK